MRRALRDLAREPQQVRAGDEEATPGLGRHLGELGAGQARVERVAHRADAHDRVERLEMGLGVPGKGCHPIPERDIEFHQNRGHTLTSRLERGVANPVHRAAGTARHHLRPRMPLRGMVEKPVERQREILHGVVDHRGAVRRQDGPVPIDMPITGHPNERAIARDGCHAVGVCLDHVPSALGHVSRKHEPSFGAPSVGRVWCGDRRHIAITDSSLSTLTRLCVNIRRPSVSSRSTQCPDGCIRHHRNVR